ncbi:hypothetical protein OHB35_01705 [Streptomyces phaeochromogenes]|uniref:Uncharacterized protein n=1 Tax=Streptomyces phaeochromogenes TaxID=1923 RepID=A0ABZ1H0F4_STRPH|nr:hypothetical protein [Streptomyces phaeochromogenes]WSD12027.1 hypothetical protein OHB35_01705 [Streptomyces phaeochromogenes]
MTTSALPLRGASRAIPDTLAPITRKLNNSAAQDLNAKVEVNGGICIRWRWTG